MTNRSKDSQQYYRALMRCPEARKFLKSRVVSLAAIREFDLGYEDSKLSKHLYGRLLFPVRDEYGELVAYQGRAVLKGLTPKYWHTTGDWKSTTLYGLWENGEKIVKLDLVALMESNMDVLAAYDIGMPAIATMGTALTPQQCIKLRRFTSKVVIVKQLDEASERSSEKWYTLLKKYELDVSMIQLPKSLRVKDTSELLKVHGIAKAREIYADYI